MNNLSIDIFCQVIDNYGDIGVCWRLANQFSQPPFNATVRLWVDDLTSFKRLQPKVNLSLINQFVDGVEVVLWDVANNDGFEKITPHELVIEAFACELPQEFKSKLNPENNIWLNLEYLSAEDWVKDFHLQPSPQNNGMIKYFFMPGFNDATGGLIREVNLQKSIEKNALLQKLGVSINTKNSLLITYFCYANARFDLLIKAIAKQDRDVVILIPQGLKLNFSNTEITKNTGLVGHAELTQMLGFDVPKKLQIYIIPFVDQLLFDQILFNADINFVRGEDSLVRAIWAQKPFVWQPYIQDDDLHLTKLSALLNVSTLNYQTKQLMLDWSNTSEDFVSEFCNALDMQNYQVWIKDSLKWSKQLAKQKDLATAIFEFVNTKRGYDIR